MKSEKNCQAAISEAVDIAPDVLRAMYTTMVMIRRFEEKIIELYPEQEIKTPVHLYIGEEAIAAGVCANLEKDDYIFSTHRCHGHYIAKGGDLGGLMAELYGKKTGCSKGKGGSMHLVDPEVGILGTSSIVGGITPLAVGTALASAMQKNGRISVAFVGDGGVDEGSFQESLNFASLKKLPVIFVCENNFYAVISHQRARQSADNIVQKAESYLVPGTSVNGNDVIGVFRATRDAVARAKRGDGPSLIECRTYRWMAHVGPNYDYESGARPREELDDWMKRCPLKSYEEFLLRRDVISASEIARISERVDKEIEEAVIFAKNSDYPERNELLEDVYSEG